MTDIYLKADRKIIEDLTIEQGYEGDRDKNGVIQGDGGCLFKTSKGKNLFLRWTEFCFYQDGRPATVARNLAAAKSARRKKPLMLAPVVLGAMAALAGMAVTSADDTSDIPSILPETI